MNTIPASRRDNRLYTGVAILAVCIVFAGFCRSYYLKGQFGTPVLPLLVHLHGLVMTLWYSLFLLQVRLVAMGRADLHRRIGPAAALLAALLVPVGMATAVHAARHGYTLGPPPLVFLAVPLTDMLVFAGLVGTALRYRRRGDIHKRLMALAALSLLPPAISRIPIGFIQSGSIAVILPMIFLLVIGCVAFDTARNRRLHPAFGWGAGLLLASYPLRLLVAGTDAWMRFAQWLIA